MRAQLEGGLNRNKYGNYIFASVLFSQLRHNNAPSLQAKGTFGWGRVGVVGTLISFVVLISQYFGTTVEALQTITHLGHGHLDALHDPVQVCFLAFMHFCVWCVVFKQLGGKGSSIIHVMV